ncbi:heparinase [Terrimonas sp.]|uniref:heparinase II/III domain-containing protein n=1 Tax=Terrimonas sp. TaxID=1914338 RepID=UPI000D509C36|nr:heparinase II/III family protein [Terrimonas sp.]PVD50248.1 heparinase [Terrimonas sp.]
MKILVFSFLLMFAVQVSAQQNVLSGKYSAQELRQLLIPQKEWMPFPHLSDREAWYKADETIMKAYLAKAESYINYEWPAIPATTSLLIERTGERAGYEKISFEKRSVLGTLVLGEVYENKGRFIDAIINGVWSVCEESFWGVSAHLPRTKEYAGLMDVSKPFVDLFSAETATFLSWVDYFVGDKLDQVSPQIRRRIYFEVNNRIFEPLMTKPHGWMKANANGRPPNNWNPWICSNWLNTALLLEKDDIKRTEMVNKILHVLDEFLNPYPEDGGCDEGPGYWGAAAASLYDNLAMLNLATRQAFKYVYDNEKIKNMARFIYRAQIGKEYFIDFADADPKPTMAASMIYRFGKDIRDTAMMQFGAFYRKSEDGTIGRFQYFRNLFELFMQEEYRSVPQALPLPADVWLPGIQVMVARDREGSTKGFFVAAKGGHNDESHNHNDVGNYIVYYDGLPVLIDIGRGTYTRKTFSDQRYEIWNNCSDYHNLPTINGHTQSTGAAFKARDVSYTKNKKFSELELDIVNAYPENTGIDQWQRTIRLNRSKNVEIIDNASLKQPGDFTQHLMTCYPAELKKNGEVVIHYRNENGETKNFIVQYNPSQMKAVIEKIPLVTMEDKGVKDKWGDNIYRINLSGNIHEKNIMKFIIKPE